MTNPQKQGLIFDGDDTLWDNQAFYEEAKQRLYQILVGQGGLAAYLESAQIAVHDVVQVIERIDMRNMEQEGFSSGRFSKSLVQTYESLSTKAGLPLDPQVTLRLRRLGDSVPRRKRTPLPGAMETLETLSGIGTYTLVLYSAGENSTQLRKLRQTGLEGFFEGHVHIVPMKDDASMLRMIEAEDLDIPSSWMIGNSLRSEINPALRLGLNCIWFHNGGWAYDESEEPAEGRLFETHSLPEVVEIIERS